MPRRKPLIDFDEEFGRDSQIRMSVGQNCEFNYEITISFDPKRHTKATAFAAQPKILTYIASWLPNVYEIHLILEYQKNGMPHYHINVGTNDSFKDGVTFDIMRGFERFYGQTWIRPIHDIDAWNDYLRKELDVNETRYSFPHWYWYQRNDDYATKKDMGI